MSPPPALCPPGFSSAFLPDKNDLNAVALNPARFSVQVLEIPSDARRAFGHDGLWRLGPRVSVQTRQITTVQDVQQPAQLPRNCPSYRCNVEYVNLNRWLDVGAIGDRSNVQGLTTPTLPAIHVATCSVFSSGG